MVIRKKKIGHKGLKGLKGEKTALCTLSPLWPIVFYVVFFGEFLSPALQFLETPFAELLDAVQDVGCDPVVDALPGSL